MQITITRQQLIEKEACQPALDELDRLGVKDICILHWNQAAQGFCLGSEIGKKFLFWLYFSGLIPIFSFYRADLSGADLSGAEKQSITENEFTIWP